MAGYVVGYESFLAEDGTGSGRDREQCGLRIFREPKSFFRAVETQFGERETESFIRFSEYACGNRILICERLAHARELGTLSGE